MVGDSDDRYRGEELNQVSYFSLHTDLNNRRTYAHTSNHGSFYFNQLAALQLLVDDKTGAQKTIDEYFDGIYMGQISANGDQVRARLLPDVS